MSSNGQKVIENNPIGSQTGADAQEISAGILILLYVLKDIISIAKEEKHN